MLLYTVYLCSKYTYYFIINLFYFYTHIPFTKIFFSYIIEESEMI